MSTPQLTHLCTRDTLEEDAAPNTTLTIVKIWQSVSAVAPTPAQLTYSCFHINPKIMNFAVDRPVQAAWLSLQCQQTSWSIWKYVCVWLCVCMCAAVCGYSFSCSYIMKIIPEKCDSELMPWRSYVERASLPQAENITTTDHKCYSLNGANKTHTGIHL